MSEHDPVFGEKHRTGPEVPRYDPAVHGPLPMSEEKGLVEELRAWPRAAGIGVWDLHNRAADTIVSLQQRNALLLRDSQMLAAALEERDELLERVSELEADAQFTAVLLRTSATKDQERVAVTLYLNADNATAAAVEGEGATRLLNAEPDGEPWWTREGLLAVPMILTMVKDTR